MAFGLLISAVLISVAIARYSDSMRQYADVLGSTVSFQVLPTFAPPSSGSYVRQPPLELEILPSPTPDVIEKSSVWDLVQRWRADNGLPMYQQNDRVCEIAQQRLNEVKTNWSHDGFRWERFCPNGDCLLSENLARKFSTEQSVLDGWLSSSSHRANLQKDYQYACIATDGNYVVHILGNFVGN